jgi:hypothetical protein
MKPDMRARRGSNVRKAPCIRLTNPPMIAGIGDESEFGLGDFRRTEVTARGSEWKRIDKISGAPAWRLAGEAVRAVGCRFHRSLPEGNRERVPKLG